MRKQDVLAVYGTATKVAEALRISVSAVSMWGETIPKLRAFELRAARPTIDEEIAEVQARRTADLPAATQAAA